MSRFARWAPFLVGALGLAITLGWMYRDRLFPPPSPPLATVEAASGEVRCGSLALTAGATVGQGDRVEVAAGARATIRSPARERFELEGPATVEILKLRPSEATELWLHHGALFADSPPHEKRASPLVYTHEATIAAVSARWQIVAADGVTTLRVGRGRLRVDGLHQTKVTVGAGQRLEIRRGDGQEPSQPSADPSAIADLDR